MTERHGFLGLFDEFHSAPLDEEQKRRYEELLTLEFEIDTLVTNVYGFRSYGRPIGAGPVDPHIKTKVERLLARFAEVTGVSAQNKIHAATMADEVPLKLYNTIRTGRTNYILTGQKGVNNTYLPRKGDQ